MLEWENNVRMDLKVIVVSMMNWSGLTQGRSHWSVLINLEMNFWVPRCIKLIIAL